MRTPALTSILAATDLTEASDDILRTAGALAAATGAELHVLHAFDIPSTAYPESTPPTFPDRVGDAVRRLEEQIARTVPDRGRVASREVMIYAAHRAILDRARDVGAGLVVLGPHRRRPLGDTFLGSTADRLLRTADAPCLVVRGALPLPLRRVVVPLDLSEPARGALEMALAWAGGLGAYDHDTALPEVELDVLHVVPRSAFLEGADFDHATLGPRLHRDVEAALEAVASAGGVEVREEVVWGGDPAEEIVRYAGRRGAELLVLGTHGYGAVRRALIGSVASAVARRAPCSALLVPPSLWRGARGDFPHAAG